MALTHEPSLLGVAGIQVSYRIELLENEGSLLPAKSVSITQHRSTCCCCCPPRRHHPWSTNLPAAATTAKSTRSKRHCYEDMLPMAAYSSPRRCQRMLHPNACDRGLNYPIRSWHTLFWSVPINCTIYPRIICFTHLPDIPFYWTSLTSHFSYVA